MRFYSRVLSCMLALLVIGCVRVPVESAALSERVGQDLATLQASHLNLARQYFSAMRDSINGFVDDRYRPFIIRQSIEELGLVDALQDAIDNPGELDALDIMEIYTDEAIRQIESFRREMLAPIEAQESALLADLERAYAIMRNANATVTAHLRSIRSVQASQAELLSQLGLPDDLRERVSTGAARLSQGVNRILSEARAADELIDDLPDRIQELADSL